MSPHVQGRSNVSRIGRIVLGLALAGLPAAAAEKAGPYGHIYGTVETEAGRTYTGLLRWGTEEAFWDDLFNSSKSKLPFLEEHGTKEQRRNRITVFGFTVGYRWDEASQSRMLIARFGDIAEIEVRGGEKVRLTMRDGSTIDAEGASNDVGAKITVWDDSLGQVELDWDRIQRIRFRATPAGVKPPGRRLFGTVQTEGGSFEGFIQWDSQECLSTDRLDGETEDGNMSIEMGKIKAIAKRNRNGSHVELTDGRKLVLEGTNDVDSSLRGIFVEDPRYGRVEVPWEAFERVEFRETDRTGRGYDDYKPAGQLSGTVTDSAGQTHSGRLVFDLDEEANWELLNGIRDGVEYYIPFGLVRSVEPQRGEASRIVLRNGEELTLGEGQDVTESNAGVVVIRDGGGEKYLPWSEVKQIAFEPAEGLPAERVPAEAR